MKILINKEIQDYKDCYVLFQDGTICYAQPKEFFIEFLERHLNMNKIDYSIIQDETGILSIEFSSMLLLS